jgi:hypothetical protein
MATVTWHLGRSALVDWLTIVIALVSLFLLLRFRVNTFWLVLAGALAGLGKCHGLSPDQAEKRAVVALIAAIQQNPAYRPNHRIAVVTDHDLGSHIAINARDVPLWSAGMLPANFSLKASLQSIYTT